MQFSVLSFLSYSRAWWKACGGVEGWLGRIGWQHRSLKNVLLLPLPARVVAIRGLLLSNNSLVTCLHRQTPRLLTELVTLTSKEQERKRERERSKRVRVLLGTIQFDSFNSSIHSQARTYSGSLAIYNRFLSVFNFSLCLSERRPFNSTAIPTSRGRHSLSTSAPHRAANSVCLSSPDGHGVGGKKGRGNCLFIPSEEKIEYRNPSFFFPRVVLSVRRCWLRSLIRSPPGLHSDGKKKGESSGTLGTPCWQLSLQHRPTKQSNTCGGRWLVNL